MVLADATTPESAAGRKCAAWSRRRIGLGLLFVALFIATGVRSGDRIWLWLAYERRPVRLTDFVSSRKHVCDPRISIIHALRRGNWFVRTVVSGEDLAGWEVVRRWDSHDRRSIELWALDSGLRRCEAGRFGDEIRFTRRDPLGRVLEQSRYDTTTAREWSVSQAPWQWDEGDESRPDAPWILAGIDFEEWWESVHPR